MPTTPFSSRTPGRAYSMSRLDINPQLPTPPKTSASLSSAKSMHSLAGAPGHKSMLHIAPIPPPRLTRAERLRKKAKDSAKAAAATGTLHAFLTRPVMPVTKGLIGSCHLTTHLSLLLYPSIFKCFHFRCFCIWSPASVSNSFQ